MAIIRMLTAGILLGMAAGCAPFKVDWTGEKVASDRPNPLAAAAKPAADVAVLEVSFVPVRGDDPQACSVEHGDESGPPNRSLHEELWRWVDETAIAPEVRSALRQNGVRVGRVHTQSEFARALQAVRRMPVDKAQALLESASVSSDVSREARRIPCRFGKRYELPLTNPLTGDLPILVSTGGTTVGKTLSNPQPLFAVTVQSVDSARVRLRLQPEIQHGNVKQTWVSNDSALRIDNRRDSWSFTELAFSLDATVGDTLIAGGSLPAHGLGAQMFTGKSADGELDQVVAVIKVSEIPDLLQAP